MQASILRTWGQIMRALDPSKLRVEYRDDITTEDILGRKYTITHSDESADLFNTIGKEYALDKLNWMRDEVYFEWDQDEQGIYYLNGIVDLDGGGIPVLLDKRDEIFRREMPLALEGATKGDLLFYEENPDLKDAQIWIHFISENPEYQRYEFWGTPQEYLDRTWE